MTIDKIAGEWYVKEACVKPGSVDTYYSCYIYHLSLIIGDREAEDLREEELLRIFRGFKDKKMGYPAISGIRAALHRIMSYAVKAGYTGANPVPAMEDIIGGRGGHIHIEKKHTKKPDPRFMDFLAGYDKMLYVMLSLLLESGMRLGELGALLRRNIDTEGGFIYIEGTLLRLCKARFGFSRAICTPKTAKSRRSIPIGSRMKMLLCAWMQSANHPSHAVPVLDDGGNITGYESDFVFVSGRGEPITRDTFQKRLKRAVERYNRFIDPGMKYFNPHTTRHIFTCIMYERTHDIKLVSAMLGHASTSTTMDIYNHLSNKQEETMRSVIDEINEEEDRERGRSQEF